MKPPVNPEIRKGEHNPYQFIDEYVDELFRDKDPYTIANLMGVSDTELRLLEPLYPRDADYVRPRHLGEQLVEYEGTSLFDKLVFNALSRSQRKNQRVSTHTPFNVTRNSRRLIDNSIDLMLTVGQLQLDGALTIDGETVIFSPDNKLITVEVMDSDAHNDGRQPQDSITYYYMPLSGKLSVEPKKGQRHPNEALRVPHISAEKSDVENLQALFEEYSTDSFLSY